MNDKMAFVRTGDAWTAFASLISHPQCLPAYLYSGLRKSLASALRRHDHGRSPFLRMDRCPLGERSSLRVTAHFNENESRHCSGTIGAND